MSIAEAEKMGLTPAQRAQVQKLGVKITMQGPNKEAGPSRKTKKT